MPFTIVHVLSSFGLGGQERVALDLATAQRAAGHDVVAVSLAQDDGPVATELRAAGARIATMAKSEGFDVGLFARLTMLFVRERARIVHTHNPQPLIYAAAPARAARARVVHTKHGENPATRRRLRLRKAAAVFVDAFVAVSEATAVAARASDESRGRPVRVIPNGIDLTRFSVGELARRAIRRELSIPEGAWVGCVVGRLCPEKQQALAIRAAIELSHLGVHLLVVGDGPLRRPMHELAARSPLPGAIHILGARSDIPRILAASDAMILPSLREGLPLVIPEAMAAGLPVVASAVGGIPDVIIDGETGFLVPSGDEGALRDRMATLIADRTRGRAMGERGLALAQAMYSRERMASDYQSVYREVLS